MYAYPPLDAAAKPMSRTNNRPAALAIRAFNVETAAIKDSVRGNVIPGKMRMQWWKDSLAGDTGSGCESMQS